jgi:hypothetical protein
METEDLVASLLAFLNKFHQLTGYEWLAGEGDLPG